MLFFDIRKKKVKILLFCTTEDTVVRVFIVEALAGVATTSAEVQIAVEVEN